MFKAGKLLSHFNSMAKEYEVKNILKGSSP